MKLQVGINNSIIIINHKIIVVLTKTGKRLVFLNIKR